jgi:hypothetical protein
VRGGRFLAFCPDSRGYISVQWTGEKLIEVENIVIMTITTKGHVIVKCFAAGISETIFRLILTHHSLLRRPSKMQKMLVNKFYIV